MLGRSSALNASSTSSEVSLGGLKRYTQVLPDFEVLAEPLRHLRRTVNKGLAEPGATEPRLVLLLDADLIRLFPAWPGRSDTAAANLRFLMEYGAEAAVHVLAAVPYARLSPSGRASENPRISELVRSDASRYPGRGRPHRCIRTDQWSIGGQLLSARDR